MQTPDLLDDLSRHMEWADSLVWGAGRWARSG